MAEQVRRLCFKIELFGVEASIWRRFFVPRDISFMQFQKVISIVMGWKGRNYFSFSFGQEEFGLYMPDNRKQKLKWLDGIMVEDYFPKRGSCGQYEYDFDSGWSHVIVLEDYYTISQGDLKYLCLDGEKACPPEDSWPSAFNKLCEFKANKELGKEKDDTRIRKEMEESQTLNFNAIFVLNHQNDDLNAFNLRSINAKLGKMK